MAYVCLLLSGAALLINGLAALDRVPRRDAAVFSLVIGSAQLILGVAHLTVTAGGGTQSLLEAAGMILFGLTYVYVGLDFLLGLGSKGLGWFCGMVAVCGILLAGAWSGEDPLLAALWLCWTYLWLLFFFHMALGFELMAPLIGWSLVLTSQASATVPAFLGITGQWPAGIAAAAAAGAGLAALRRVGGGLARRGRRSGTGAAAVERPLAGELRL